MSIDDFKVRIDRVCQGSSKLTPDSINMLEVFPDLLRLQNDKGQLYGRSYCRHGSLSVFFNLERKWDRISNIMTRAMRDGTDSLYSGESDTATETFLDTVVDLSVYSLMWVGLIREERPEMYQRFLKSNDLTESDHE